MWPARQRGTDANPPLGGVHVVELGTAPAGSHCGWIYAEAGADVVKVESRDGDMSQSSSPFATLDRGKRRVSLDFGDPDGQRVFRRMTEWADVVIETLPTTNENPCLPYSRMARVNPGVVLTSISPFGRTGPYAKFAGDELVVDALGGLLYGVGEPDREPLVGSGIQSELLAGVAAHFATMVALLARERDGSGQHVDVSIQATVATLLEGALTMASYNGWTWRRSGHRRTVSYHPVANYACRDGYVNISVLEEREWRTLCELLNCYDLAEDQRLASAAGRLQNADEIDQRLERALQAWTRFEFYHAAQARRLACGPVIEIDELCTLPQLLARGFCDPVSGWPTLPFLVDGLRVTGDHSARESTQQGFEGDNAWRESTDHASIVHRGKSPSTAEPLNGVRVLDCTHSWAGPLATRMLAYFGAEVIHVEAPERPDRWRGPVTPSTESSRTHRYPDRDPSERPYDRNALFNEMNSNKSSLVLDLASSEGKQVFRRLVEISDVVVTNFSPRATKKLGLDAETLRAVRADIISVSITGFGEVGPEATYLAWGTTVEAISGAASVKGYPGGRPLLSNMAYGDPVGGFFAATAIANALWQRRVNGSGCHIDLSLVEATSALLVGHIVEFRATGRRPTRTGNRRQNEAPRGCYPCGGDDRWIAISIRSDEEWQALVHAMGYPAWAIDERLTSVSGRWARHDYIDMKLAQWTRGQNRDELMKRLQASGVSAGSVLSNVELSADVQLHARGYFSELDHPSCGRHIYPGLPFLLSRTPGTIRLPAPTFGQHNAEILSRLLQLDDAHVLRLQRDGVVTKEPI